MNDPAVEAAQRALDMQPQPLPWHRPEMEIAAREALKPVRIWYESNLPFLKAGYEISLDGLAKLIYSEDELRTDAS